MKRGLQLLGLLLLMSCWMGAAESCTLQTYAASWMTSGTPFSVACPSGSYSGHLVSTPARRFFRRGHLMLVFDQPVVVAAKKKGDEGKIEPGRGKQIASILTAGGVGIGAKDLTDGLAGAVFKSWYMIPISGVTLAFFSNGGDVLLKPGYKIELESKKQEPSQQAMR